jgi:hypothetical protein
LNEKDGKYLGPRYSEDMKNYTQVTKLKNKICELQGLKEKEQWSCPHFGGAVCGYGSKQIGICRMMSIHNIHKKHT